MHAANEKRKIHFENYYYVMTYIDNLLDRMISMLLLCRMEGKPSQKLFFFSQPFHTINNHFSFYSWKKYFTWFLFDGKIIVRFFFASRNKQIGIRISNRINQMLLDIITVSVIQLYPYTNTIWLKFTSKFDP